MHEDVISCGILGQANDFLRYGKIFHLYIHICILRYITSKIDA
jgi:hypothetical protein